MLTAYLLQTLGMAIRLLKKRRFGFVLFLLLAVRAVVSVSLVPRPLQSAPCPTTRNDGANFAYREIALTLRL